MYGKIKGMKREMLIKLLKQSQIINGDKEATHMEIDKALLEYIDDKEITDLFNSIEKWYA